MISEDEENNLDNLLENKEQEMISLLNRKVSYLSSQLAAQANELESLRADFDHNLDVIQERDSDLAALEQTIKELQELLQSSIQHKKGLEEALEEAQKELRTKDSQLRQEREVAVEIDKHKEFQIDQLKLKINESNQNFQKEREEYQEKLRAVASAKKELEDEAFKTKEAFQRSQSQIKTELEMKIAKMVKEIAEMTKSANQKDQKSLNDQVEKNNLEKRTKELQEELKEKNKELEKAEAINKRKGDELEELKKKFEKIREENEILRGENANQSESIHRKIKAVREKYKGQISQKDREHEKSLKELQREIKRKEEEQNNEKMKLHLEINSLSYELKISENKNEELEKRLMDLNKEKENEVKGKEKSFREDEAKLKADMELLHRKIVDLEKENERLKGGIDNLVREMERKAEVVEELEQENKLLIDEVASHRQMMMGFQQEENKKNSRGQLNEKNIQLNSSSNKESGRKEGFLENISDEKLFSEELDGIPSIFIESKNGLELGSGQFKESNIQGPDSRRKKQAGKLGSSQGKSPSLRRKEAQIGVEREFMETIRKLEGEIEELEGEKRELKGIIDEMRGQMENAAQKMNLTKQEVYLAKEDSLNLRSKINNLTGDLMEMRERNSRLMMDRERQEKRELELIEKEKERVSALEDEMARMKNEKKNTEEGMKTIEEVKMENGRLKTERNKLIDIVSKQKARIRRLEDEIEAIRGRDFEESQQREEELLAFNQKSQSRGLDKDLEKVKGEDEWESGRRNNNLREAIRDINRKFKEARPPQGTFTLRENPSSFQNDQSQRFEEGKGNEEMEVVGERLKRRDHEERSVSAHKKASEKQTTSQKQIRAALEKKQKERKKTPVRNYNIKDDELFKSLVIPGPSRTQNNPVNPEN